jgi:hypothetical protein
MVCRACQKHLVQEATEKHIPLISNKWEKAIEHQLSSKPEAWAIIEQEMLDTRRERRLYTSQIEATKRAAEKGMRAVNLGKKTPLRPSSPEPESDKKENERRRGITEYYNSGRAARDEAERERKCREQWEDL